MLTLTVPIPARLRQLRQDRDLSMREISEVIGVRVPAICRWELGYRQPRIGAAVAYAAAVDHRLVVVARRHRIVLTDVIGILPGLKGLRQAAGFTQGQMAGRLYVTQAAVSNLERQSGLHTYLYTVERHLDVLGYDVVLIPAEAGQVAA